MQNATSTTTGTLNQRFMGYLLMVVRGQSPPGSMVPPLAFREKGLAEGDAKT